MDDRLEGAGLENGFWVGPEGNNLTSFPHFCDSFCTVLIISIICQSLLQSNIQQSTWVDLILLSTLDLTFVAHKNVVFVFVKKHTQATINKDMGQIHFHSKSGHHAAQKLKRQNNIFFNGNCTMVICSSHWIFIEWGVAVFELCDAPFWSQTFRFAQTDGTHYFILFYVHEYEQLVYTT